MTRKTKSKTNSTRDPIGTRLKSLNRALKHGLELRENGLWITTNTRTIHLDVPEDLKSCLWAYLAGHGEKVGTIAPRISSYGLSEFLRRFSNCFPEYESDADTLTEATDHTWKVVP